jgi:hypothetical protein
MFYHAERGEWRRLIEPSEEVLRKAPKSMKSREARRAYVEKALRKEWEGMGMCDGRVVKDKEGERKGGSSKDSAMELDEEDESWGGSSRENAIEID